MDYQRLFSRDLISADSKKILERDAIVVFKSMLYKFLSKLYFFVLYSLEEID